MNPADGPDRPLPSLILRGYPRLSKFSKSLRTEAQEPRSGADGFVTRL
jgi:hypothetical protein